MQDIYHDTGDEQEDGWEHRTPYIYDAKHDLLHWGSPGAWHSSVEHFLDEYNDEHGLEWTEPYLKLKGAIQQNPVKPEQTYHTVWPPSSFLPTEVAEANEGWKNDVAKHIGKPVHPRYDPETFWGSDSYDDWNDFLDEQAGHLEDDWDIGGSDPARYAADHQQTRDDVPGGIYTMPMLSYRRPYVYYPNEDELYWGVQGGVHDDVQGWAEQHINELHPQDDPGDHEYTWMSKRPRVFGSLYTHPETGKQIHEVHREQWPNAFSTNSYDDMNITPEGAAILSARIGVPVFEEQQIAPDEADWDIDGNHWGKVVVAEASDDWSSSEQSSSGWDVDQSPRGKLFDSSYPFIVTEHPPALHLGPQARYHANIDSYYRSELPLQLHTFGRVWPDDPENAVYNTFRGGWNPETGVNYKMIERLLQQHYGYPFELVYDDEHHVSHSKPISGPEDAWATQYKGWGTNGPQKASQSRTGASVPIDTVAEDADKLLTEFWLDHDDLRKECTKKYGFDPIDAKLDYWKHGLAEPEHHEIAKAVQLHEGVFTLEMAEKWAKQELEAARKEARRASVLNRHLGGFMPRVAADVKDLAWKARAQIEERPDVQALDNQYWQPRNNSASVYQHLKATLDKLPDEGYKLFPWVVREFKKGLKGGFNEDGTPWPEPVGITRSNWRHAEDIIKQAIEWSVWAKEHNKPMPDMMAKTFGLQEMEQWVYELSASGVDKNAIVWKDSQPVYTFDDGWHIDRVGPQDLGQEGELMGHCVGGYCDTVDNGDSTIFSLRDPKGEPHVTIEVRGEQDTLNYPENRRDRQFDIVQEQGKSNRTPIAEYKQKIDQWYDHLRDDGWDVGEDDQAWYDDPDVQYRDPEKVYPNTLAGAQDYHEDVLNGENHLEDDEEGEVEYDNRGRPQVWWYGSPSHIQGGGNSAAGYGLGGIENMKPIIQQAITAAQRGVDARHLAQVLYTAAHHFGSYGREGAALVFWLNAEVMQWKAGRRQQESADPQQKLFDQSDREFPNVDKLVQWVEAYESTAANTTAENFKPVSGGVQNHNHMAYPHVPGGQQYPNNTIEGRYNYQTRERGPNWYEQLEQQPHFQMPGPGVTYNVEPPEERTPPNPNWPNGPANHVVTKTAHSTDWAFDVRNEPPDCPLCGHQLEIHFEGGASCPRCKSEYELGHDDQVLPSDNTIDEQAKTWPDSLPWGEEGNDYYRNARTAMADRTGHPEVDALIEEFLKTPLGEPEWGETGESYRDPTTAHGRCQEVTEHFVEFAKQKGFKAYVTNTDLDEMGYQTTGEPHGEVLNEQGEIIPGFYPEHTIATIVVDDPQYPYGREFYIDFTATQYGYTDHPKVTSKVKVANVDDLVEKVRGALTPDLLHPQYRDNPKAHCYVATEALYHLLGGKDSGYVPTRLRTPENGVHWFLRAPDGHVIDATADQFDTPPDYAQGRGSGFLTREPSARARTVMERVGAFTPVVYEGGGETVFQVNDPVTGKPGSGREGMRGYIMGQDEDGNWIVQWFPLDSDPEHRRGEDLEAAVKPDLRLADYQGSTNWHTWNTKLMMDNELKHYDYVRDLVNKGGTPEHLRDYALEHIIGPSNKQQLADAQEWNAIPQHDRLDHSFEDLKDKNPGAADIVNQLGFGPDVSDYQPDLIDPELVNWDEIHQDIADENEENRRYEQGLPATWQEAKPDMDKPGTLTLPDTWSKMATVIEHDDPDDRYEFETEWLGRRPYVYDRGNDIMHWGMGGEFHSSLDARAKEWYGNKPFKDVGNLVWGAVCRNPKTQEMHHAIWQRPNITPEHEQKLEAYAGVPIDHSLNPDYMYYILNQDDDADDIHEDRDEWHVGKTASMTTVYRGGAQAAAWNVFEDPADLATEFTRGLWTTDIDNARYYSNHEVDYVADYEMEEQSRFWIAGVIYEGLADQSTFELNPDRGEEEQNNEMLIRQGVQPHKMYVTLHEYDDDGSEDAWGGSMNAHEVGSQSATFTFENGMWAKG